MTAPWSADEYFILWQNHPSIIIGRNQRMEAEVDIETAARDGIRLKRRLTGGGAVLHDGGNLNFSFILNIDRANAKSVYDFGRFIEPVCKALEKVGVNAAMSGRNDISVAGRKISGSAQALLGKRLLCHGTLLVNSDLDKMAAYLTPNREKLARHGVQSVPSRVGNIADFWRKDSSLPLLKKCLAEECAAVRCPSRGLLKRGQAQKDGFSISDDLFQAAMKLADEKYNRDSWNFGPSFRYSGEARRGFPFGEVNLRWRVEKGRLAAIAVTGDFFGVAECGKLESLLCGIPCDGRSIRKALAGVDFSMFFSGCDPREMAMFFEQSLFRT